MSEIFQRLVAKRGFSEDYLNPKYENLASPFLLPDMKKAVERIRKAVERGEKIIVYGDYDADGITASTVMNDALKLAGVKEVTTMLPDRFRDGYGMNKKVVRKAQETGVSLVVTVDCGSANGEVVEELARAGIETIITDHHECPDELPKAVAVVNPKRRDVAKCVEHFDEHLDELLKLRDLAGVGVAFNVAKAMVMAGMIPDGQEKWMLDLVLIGTLCDSMKMSGENRTLCYYGRKVLGKTRRLGVKELLRVAGTKTLNSDAIGFQIGPRLNAAGRMANAEIAFELVNTHKKVEAARLAEELEKLNAERRKQQMAAMKEFQEKGLPDDDVLVVTGDWHEGVLGIIAGRLVEDYHKPAFVLSKVRTDDGEEIYKGSGRSFGDFDLASAMKKCANNIVGGGGHAGAAGVKVALEKIGSFREQLNVYYKSLNLYEQDKYFEQVADIETDRLGELGLELLDELSALEPFGVGNEAPIFGLNKVFIVDKKLMGADEQHLRLLVRGADGKMMKLVAFSAPRKWLEVKHGSEVNALVRLESNEWNGTKSVEGRIVDLRGC